MEINRTKLSEQINTIHSKLFVPRIASISPRLVMLITFTSMSLINYIFGLASGWLLAPGDFGLLAFSQTLLTVTGLVLNSGFAWSLTASLVGADETRRASLVRGALRANLLLALGMGLVIFLLFAAGPLRPGLETWPVAVLVILTLPLLAFVAIARATVQGSERFNALSALWIVETAIKALMGVGLVMLGFGATGAIAGFLIGSLCASVVGVFYLVSILKISGFGDSLRPTFQTAGAMFAALLGMALLLNLDVLALKIFSQADRAIVGRYQAGIILANTPYYLLTSTIPILFTQVAKKKKSGKMARALGETFQLALVFLLPIEGILALFPEAALRVLFPPAYLAGAPALRILAAANAAIILVAIFNTTFQASGKPGFPGRVLLAVTFIEALVLSFIVPRWHATGAASTFLAASVVSLFILGTHYVRQVSKNDKRLALDWFARFVLAIGVGLAVCMLILIFTGSPWLAMGIGGCAYILAVLGLRLFSVSDFLRQTSIAPLEPDKGGD